MGLLLDEVLPIAFRNSLDATAHLRYAKALMKGGADDRAAVHVLRQ
jgi:hypothetical protein